jgi:hypothetical protein
LKFLTSGYKDVDTVEARETRPLRPVNLIDGWSGCFHPESQIGTKQSKLSNVINLVQNDLINSMNQIV